MEKKIDPIRQTDEEARELARTLIREAQYGSLGVLEQQTGMPLVSRIAVAAGAEAVPFFLASDLSNHSKALAADPRCSLMLGEPKGKGDPLVHPRVTVVGRAAALPREAAAELGLRQRWLARHPKAKLYIDFGDFRFYRLEVERALLNGGFGKAYVLTAEDLRGVGVTASTTAHDG